MVTREEVEKTLRQVTDPELPVSVIDLGLIQEISIRGGSIAIKLTPTSLGCGCVDWMREDIQRVVSELPDVSNVSVEVDWTRSWGPDRMSPVAREKMESWGIRT